FPCLMVVSISITTSSLCLPFCFFKPRFPQRTAQSAYFLLLYRVMAEPDLHTKPKPLDLLWHKYLRRPYKLSTFDHGGRGPVIILLHGLASSSANWEPLLPLLKDHYHCISIDLVGFGDSPKPQWYKYTMEEHIRDIHRTISSLKLSEPFTLVGHSLGGLIATRYARMLPDHVSRLVLLSPPVYGPLDSIRDRSARSRTSMYLRAYRYLRTNKKVTLQNFIRLSRIIPPLKFLILSPATWTPLIRSLEQCIENQTIIEDIVHVKARVDIFFGTFDEVVVPYNVRQLATIREVTLYPLKVNHMVGKRYAQAVAKVLVSTSRSI
ncbi:MAG: alpha/beta hydrolase, partial [Candidatus Saccharibacteria bacterium]|nr:alpha/beta hydrolase [Candidatus Saccharibacteria bacterium]